MVIMFHETNIVKCSAWFKGKLKVLKSSLQSENLYLGKKKMKYRKFGNTGPEVSEIGFGAWAIGGSWGAQNESDSLEALETALDKGVNFIDTAAG